MFIKDHHLYYDYNFLDGVFYTPQSPRLPRGRTELKFNFTKTATADGATQAICPLSGSFPE